MKILTRQQSNDQARVLVLNNDADPRDHQTEGVDRIELQFPKFNDGRAYSQAVILKKHLGFKGEVRAVGDVLVDQLLQMQRTGFDSAVLREDQNPEQAKKQLERFSGFYQKDLAGNSPELARKIAEAHKVLRQASQTGQVSQASSLGAEDVVISHMINELGLNVEIFVLDTGRLYQETLELLEQFKSTSKAAVKVFQPVQQSVVHFVEKNGLDAQFKSIALRKECCSIRKTEPLARALAGKNGWITGLRREQSSNRSVVPLVDESEERIKFNPLANWSWDEVWHYIKQNQIAYNPLHDQFYPSIGCAPCTRAISLGEDFRAGRWWWEAELEGGSAKECGLHVKKTEETQA